MSNTKAVDPNKVMFKRARVSFVQLDEAKPYEDNPTPYFTIEVLLDPKNPAHAENIAWLKSTGATLAIAEYGSLDVVEKRCFGSGDKRKRRGSTEVYTGYTGMYYAKLKGKAEQAAVGAKHFGAVMDRRMTKLANGNVAFIAPGHPEWPYGGCYCNVQGSMWALSKKSKGYAKGGPFIGMNLDAIQFVEGGEAFGRGPVNVEETFEPLPDEPGMTTGAPSVAATASDWD